MEPFVFKKFTVWQKSAAMRVNTDGVLLGAWCDYSYFKDYDRIKVLDIGTGTGVIALIAAQYLSAHSLNEISIHGIDIDAEACKDAEYNFQHSVWSSYPNISLKLTHNSLQEFSEEGFDLIISNPPYFIDSLKCQSKSKNSARHTDSLSHTDLIEGVLKRININGRFCVILPVEEGEMLLEHVEKIKAIDSDIILHPIRACYVKTTQKKAPKRVLLEFCADHPHKKYNFGKYTLSIMDNGCFTTLYISLTKDLYLRF